MKPSISVGAIAAFLRRSVALPHKSPGQNKTLEKSDSFFNGDLFVREGDR